MMVSTRAHTLVLQTRVGTIRPLRFAGEKAVDLKEPDHLSRLLEAPKCRSGRFGSYQNGTKGS
jgi:hypothetical protein